MCVGSWYQLHETDLSRATNTQCEASMVKSAKGVKYKLKAHKTKLLGGPLRFDAPSTKLAVETRSIRVTPEASILGLLLSPDFDDGVRNADSRQLLLW